VTKVPPFMGDFSDDDINWAIEVGNLRRVSAGDSIIVEGEPVHELFVILKGAFQVVSRQLRQTTAGRLGPGEIVGEMSYINKRLPISSVRALEDSAVLCIPRTALTEKIAADTGFEARFHRVVSEFTAARLYDWWSQTQPEPAPDEGVLRVYELIERMLRGEFPDQASSRMADPPKDEPPRKPGGGRKPPPRKPRKKDEPPESN
jgi:CRP/FNR family transcriptional regulator, cyclic AMP receptor protein